MNSKDILIKIKNEGLFTAGLTLDEYVADLCKRFSKMYDEILPTNDYDYIVKKLKEKNII